MTLQIRHAVIVGVALAVVEAGAVIPPEMMPPGTRGEGSPEVGDADDSAADAPLPTYGSNWAEIQRDPPPIPVFDATVYARRGYIALVGGFDADLRTTPVIQIHHPTRGWMPIGTQMGEPRARHTMTPLADGRMFIAGGVQGQIGAELHPLATCEILDPLRAGTTVLPPLQRPLVSHTVHVLDDDRVAVVSGEAVHVFDIERMKWTDTVQLHRTRLDHTSVLLEVGSILVIGGDAAGTIEEVTFLPDGAKSELWQQTLDRPVESAGAVRIDDSRVLVAGGIDREARSSVDDSWILNAADRSIQRGPTLQVTSGVADPTIVQQQGLIVVLGGEWVTPNDRGPVVEARVYDPGEDRLWQIAPIPIDATRLNWYRDERGFHCATGGFQFIPPGETRDSLPPGAHVTTDSFRLNLRRIAIIED